MCVAVNCSLSVRCRHSTPISRFWSAILTVPVLWRHHSLLRKSCCHCISKDIRCSVGPQILCSNPYSLLLTCRHLLTLCAMPSLHADMFILVYLLVLRWLCSVSLSTNAAIAHFECVAFTASWHLFPTSARVSEYFACCFHWPVF